MPTYTWLTPKTNWVSTDYYNANDINRVENNIGMVRQMLVAIGYNISAMTINTSRVNSNYDLVSSINRIENNLNNLRLEFVTPTNWLPLITWTIDTKLTHNDANRWESNIKSLYDLATAVPQSFRHAGTFNSAQEVLPQI
jgi:hypothetical protein